jgi:hypothetical protein
MRFPKEVKMTLVFSSGITLTREEALRIQSEQVERYVGLYGEWVRDVVAEATTADALADGPHEVFIVNRHIPRGGALEALIAAKRMAMAPSPAIKAAAPVCQTVREFSPCGPCLTRGELIRTTGKFYVYRDRHDAERRISCSKAHVEPRRRCRDHAETSYPHGYMD